MKAAPIKGDCLICQAPEPTRLAVNAAIWTKDGQRYTTYVARGMAAGRSSEVPSLATLSRNAVLGHVKHIEGSWREVALEGVLVGREAPVVPTDYVSATDPAVRAGVTAARLLEHALETAGADAFSLFAVPDLVSIAKMGATVSGAREKTRLQKGALGLEIAAVFGLGSGHLPAPADQQADEVLDLEDMRAELAAEREEIVTARDDA